MEKEHKVLFEEIENNLYNLRDLNGQYIIYTLNYINDENQSAFELLLFEQNYLTQPFILNKILNKIHKNSIVSEIYILDEFKTFVIQLLTLDGIRNNKLKKIKNKLELIT